MDIDTIVKRTKVAKRAMHQNKATICLLTRFIIVVIMLFLILYEQSPFIQSEKCKL